MLEAIIVVVAIAFDQISKYFVVQNMYNSSMEFIPGFQGFRYCENTGAAFSFFDDGTVILTILSIVLFVALVYFMIKVRKENGPWQINASIALIAGGAVGNLIDRLFLGYVVDFLEFQFMDFAIFNVADCFICIGAALLIIYLIFTKKGRDFFKNFEKPKKESTK